MAESNAEWGWLAELDDELAATWDGFDRLPEPGENEHLDQFCTDKNIDIPALMRLGTKLQDEDTLAFAYQGGIKFRDVVTGRRWNYLGSEFKHLRIVPAQEGEASSVILAEGETDAARLTMLYPQVDVAVLPAGARRWTDTFTKDVAEYAQVLIGLDNDEAGEVGAKKVEQALPNAQRFAPPGLDWCTSPLEGGLPPIPEPKPRISLMVPAGELLDLEAPEVVSWFESALLPIGGQLVLHGWAKSFKSFLALDMMAALAQGVEWAGFAPTEEPAKVAVVQFEIPWPFYQQRVAMLSQAAHDRALFNENFITYSPLVRPNLSSQAGQDQLLKELIEHDVQVVSMDPLRRMVGGLDLNSEKDVRVPLSFFERLQDEGITVVFCHHNNKTGARTGDEIAMTGSGAIAGDADTILSVTLPKGAQQDDPFRNIHFNLRNGPSPMPRGFAMELDGHMTYGEPHTEDDDDGGHQPGI